MGKEKPLIEKLREYIILENDIQNMEYIELSYTGELIPFEIVEGKFAESIEKLKEEEWDLFSSFLDGEIGYIELAQKRKQLFDKIMGEFKNGNN